MIELKQVKKNYNQKTVLNVENLTFNDGDIIGLIGKNGAGKTTLAEIILGTNNQNQGQIIYDPAFKKLRRNAVFQESSFESALNLKQLVKFYQDIFHLEINIEQLFQEFGLQNYQKRKYSKLSGGEKQRFKLLIALMNQPNLVLLDELANSLDYETKKWVIDYIKKYDSINKIVIIISHDPHEIEALCNRIIKLEHGQIVADFYLEKTKNQKQNFKKIEELMSHESPL